MKKIVMEDRLPGGVDAKNLKKYLNRFDPKEVKMGTEHEKEHTKNAAIAAEIASDHLHDEPHYYSKLKKAKIESTDVFEFNFHDILEWDDDVPLGALVQKVKEPEVKKETPKSTYQIRKERSKQNKIKKDEIHAQRRHLFRMDLLKSGKAEHEVNASLADFDKEYASKPSRGYAPSGIVSKTHKKKTRAYTFTPLSPGPEPKAEKQKVLPSAWIKPKIAEPVVPVEEPSRAKNAVDTVFKSKKTDPRYSDTVKSGK